MSLFKLELRSKTPTEKVSLGNTHIAAMGEPQAILDFPVPNRMPTDVVYAATVAAVDTTNQAADAAEIAWKQANAARDAAVATFDMQTTARMNYCEATKPGDVTALTGTGLPMKQAPAPAGPLGAPQNLRVSMGDMAGEDDLMWDPLKGAATYLVYSREHLVAGDWIQAGATTKSKFTVTGLTSGKTYAFRVQGVGKDGPGPFSDETVKMAP